ncbi:hypothetical protein F5884DRAFT_818169 [Xylogone sp. PMI_703]|nr:hypothetical protein F5884DRAFT_818169 [Xylogone sp. PMI_703]
MTRGTGKRLYRACQRCRQRKLKCDLNGIGELGRPPCFECFRIGTTCTLASSRRGGNYTHLRKQNEASMTRKTAISGPALEAELSLDADLEDSSSRTDSLSNGLSREPVCAELKNPFDALQILAKAAVENAEPENIKTYDSQKSSRYDEEQNNRSNSLDRNTRVELDRRKYPLLTNGSLDTETINMLLKRFEQNYHPFVPVAPRHVLAPSNTEELAEDEPFLLTAILTIASKHDSTWERVHKCCWDYMKQLLLDLLLGSSSTQSVGSVEGLLLLSDWVPYIPPNRPLPTNSPRGEVANIEDSTAWTLVGQAIRQAYLLRLDRMSFHEKFSAESKDQVNRKRLAWTFVYFADRQISVRMGQSFWSRGPSLSSRLTANDFPTLKPSSDGEDDYAAVLHATLELTQLIHNAHDVLYSSKRRTLEIMLTGDYSRYLDDFSKSLLAWNEAWEGLNVSPKLKYSLRLMSEYLCLYINAFSFQSVISRASSRGSTLLPTLSNHGQFSSLFSRGVTASADGRYIFEGIRAAKTTLKLMAEINPTTILRFMPYRFYLYGVYSAVFLYRTDVYGALTMKEEHDEIILLVQDFISALEMASTDSQHIGVRYSKLLRSLKFPRRARDTAVDDDFHDVSLNSISGVPGMGVVGPQNTDPFYSNFLSFDTDLFGMVTQGDLNFDTLGGY